MKQVTITRAQHEGVVAVARGDATVIELPDQPTTGYRWEIDSVDPALVEIEGSEFGSSGPGIGAGGIATWRLRARAPGRTRLEFARRRPWERDRPPIERFAVTLEIADG
jgi:inhibitor of cysteine peptidase